MGCGALVLSIIHREGSFGFGQIIHFDGACHNQFGQFLHQRSFPAGRSLPPQCIPLPGGLRPGPHGCFALLFYFPCASASMAGPGPVPTYASTLHSTWLFCLVAFVLLVLLLQYTGTQVGSLLMNAALFIQGSLSPYIFI